MPYELFLAIRHLRAQGRRRFARVTALIAVTGIAVGVAALIFALALANGFRDEMRNKILSGTAHLTVMRSDGQAISDYAAVTHRLRELPAATSAAGTTYDGAVISGRRGSAYAVLRGIDTEGGENQATFLRTLVEGSADQLFEGSDRGEIPAAVIGSELSARTGLKVGDTAEVIAAQANLTASNPRLVKITGIFRSGLYEYDSTWIYLSLESAGAFSGNSHAASVVSVQVKDVYNVKQVSDSVRQLLGPSYTVIDWQEANRPLFTALAAERRVGIVIIGLIILIGALNITTTLILIVMERRREIGVLNTLGATSRSILSIFIIEGGIMGLAGAIAGVLLGAAAVLIANHYQLVSLPADVYSISSVPLSASARDMLIAALVAFLLSIIATIYPAHTATRIRAAEILRDN